MRQAASLYLCIAGAEAGRSLPYPVILCPFSAKLHPWQPPHPMHTERPPEGIVVAHRQDDK